MAVGITIKKTQGDAHYWGAWIVINSTFTAGGLPAPIFATVFGLRREEMPNREIITVPVPGLTAGSHQNIYSGGTGYVNFVRGGYEKKCVRCV